MDGEFAGNQSCTGIGETWGKQFAADGLQAQACLPVDGILVKGNACTAKVGSYVWFRYGSGRIMADSLSAAYMEREPGRSGGRPLSGSYRKRYQIRVLRAPPYRGFV